MMEKAYDILKKFYGYDSFKEGQKEAISSILDKRDTMVIMPTGAGKSICYQIPALIFEGITLVISPLISLMKDQVDSLQSVGIDATYINSTLTYNDINYRLQEIMNGKYKVIYIAPERLDTDVINRLVSKVKISFIAVDEAHCVSQWGHDFRPSYIAINYFINKLEQRPIVAALTATATVKVQEDITVQLGLLNPTLIKNGYDRENLSFTVLKGVNKNNFILDYTSRHKEESGIVYVGTRKDAENVCKLLIKNGIKSGCYHGGMNPDERQANQEKFIYDDIEVIVATNAFGMGIDKSNVRYVIHYNMPENIEAYYQEAGRAGRDGLPSKCILLFAAADVGLRRYLIDQSEGLDENRKYHKYEKLQQMTQYAHVSTCLRKYILDYFGDSTALDNCDNCSNCKGDIVKEDMTVEAQKILSCIARAKERFGTKVIAEILKGSKNKRIIQLRLNQLSTYGLLSELTIQSIKDRINLLAAEGYIHITNDEYPIAKLTEKSIHVLKGEEKVYRNIIKQETGIVKQELFDELKALRKEIASNEHIPPYHVFSDATLKEMCIKYPTNKIAMLDVKGVGLSKYDRYGQLFINTITEYVDKNDIQVDTVTRYKVSVEDKKNKTKDSKEQSCMVSARLFVEHNDIEVVAKQRNIKVRTVEDHIFEAYANGFDIDLDCFIPNGYEQIILDTIKEVGASRLRPIKEASDNCVTYNAIKAVIAKNKLSSTQMG